MNPERLMTEPVTLEHRAVSAGEDAYGNALPGTLERTTVFAYLEQSGTNEDTADRDTTFESWRIFLPAGTPVTTADVIIRADGVRLEIDGAPWSARNPRTGVVTHIETRGNASEG